MKILIIGAAGMIGSKLAEAINSVRTFDGQTLTDLHLVDVVQPALPGRESSLMQANDQALTDSGAASQNTRSEPDTNVLSEQADISDEQAITGWIDREPDVIFHLAAIVSGQAEQDFGLGYQINLDGTRQLFEAIRIKNLASGYQPKVIFASSIAVYGSPLPELIDDEFHLKPLTSYGTQKAIGELLLSDYSRKTYFTGVGIRLPTICIRPGKPNQAASSFFSNILREPIHGKSAVLPVEESVKHWFASPRAAVQFLIHAMGLSREQLGNHYCFNLPGLCATVGEQLEALANVVGSDAVKLVRFEADPVVRHIVGNWPRAINAERAIGLGFKAETSFDEIINVYLDDDYHRGLSTSS